ncbi:hypothetical protein M8C21_004782 [Ambrosia artemisiifolia]|uniref:Uncharacterized protein n=1 Tax=Ambrosia artemisiifolia TaxID=4212 RepID=A0AAD5BNS5_AMBAR|nr:hypothetical protein M8C21_004782 [Ambrosia artemisiifolia]
MKVEDVNRCAYVCGLMRESKNNWDRLNNSKYFNGALTILVLLYVDRTVCGDINRVRMMHPIVFWTKEMLSKREKFEIRNGGFGRGELRDAYVDLEGGDGYKNDAIKLKEDENTETVEGHIMKIESLIDCIVEKKDVLDKYIIDACSKFPNNDKVAGLVETYDCLFGIKMNVSTCEGNDVQCGVNNNVMVPKSSKDNTTVDVMDSKKSDGVEDVEHCDKVETGKVYIGVLRGKNVYIRANKKIGTKGDEGKVINDGNVDDIIKDVIVNTEADVVERRRSKRTKVVDNTVPSFSLLSQSSLESDLEDDEMGVQEVNLNRPLEDEEKLLWQYLLTTVVDKERVDRKKDVNDNESIDIELEKKEVKMSFMKKIFETDYGLTTMTYLITSLREGKEVESNVIACRASILNFNERKLKQKGRDARIYVGDASDQGKGIRNSEVTFEGGA